jgi:hypothetical protein
LPNPSSRIVALTFTKAVTEMSRTDRKQNMPGKNIAAGAGADSYTATCELNMQTMWNA